MPHFVVSADLRVPVLVSVEAKNEDEAELKVLGMDRKKLLHLANTEPSGILVEIDGVSFDVG